MNDHDRHLTPVHAADEFQGSVFGIETHLFAWVAMGLLASLGLFLGLFYGAESDFLNAAGWAVLPTVAVILYLRLVHQGKPPGFTLELLDSLLTGGHVRPPRQHPRHPFHNV